MLESIIDTYPDDEFLKVDGYDEAIIGVDMASSNLIYSYAKMIEIMMEEGMDQEEAREYFDFNIAGAYMGEKTPIFCNDEF
jgi:hypothetical protein